MVKKQSYPYAGTTVAVEKTKEEINDLLRKYNVHGAQWTELWTEKLIELRFPVEFEFKGRTKGVTVSVRPPLFEATHKSYDPKKGYVTVKAPDYKAAMRCLYYYIKTKLEAITYGLSTIEEEFMSRITFSLADGSEKTLSQVLTQRIVEGDLSKLALDSKNVERPVRQIPEEKVVDVESQTE